MKYYSKSPTEFREDLKESAREAQSKRKKSYLMQLANFGILMVALFLMVKGPGMMKKNNAAEEKAGSEIKRSMAWKSWSLESVCKPADHCTLGLTRNGKEMAADSFYWKVSEKESGKTVMKNFELIPKNMKINEMRNFHFDLNQNFESLIISVHFMDNKNDEVISMQIYPSNIKSTLKKYYHISLP